MFDHLTNLTFFQAALLVIIVWLGLGIYLMLGRIYEKMESVNRRLWRINIEEIDIKLANVNGYLISIDSNLNWLTERLSEKIRGERS